MMKYLINSIIFLLILIITSCSTPNNTKVELPLKVTKSEINTWLNLMPGVKQGKFHLTGKVTLENTDNIEIGDINLKNITVYSSKEVIYSFKPYFKNQIEGDDFKLKKGVGKVFAFGTEEGLKINNSVVDNEIISIKLNFISDEGSYSYMIDSVKVVKAY